MQLVPMTLRKTIAIDRKMMTIIIAEAETSVPPPFMCYAWVYKG